MTYLVTIYRIRFHVKYYALYVRIYYTSYNNYYTTLIFINTTLSYSGYEISNEQYTLVCNVELSFTVDGNTTMCYNYNITNDAKCELENEATSFNVQIGLLSSDNGVHIGQGVATVFIDDTNEPECCKCRYLYDLYCHKTFLLCLGI